MVVFRTLGWGGPQAKAWQRNFSKSQSRRTFGHLRCAIRRLLDWPKVGPPNKFIDTPSPLGKNGLSCYSIWIEGVFHPTNERSFMAEETSGFKK